MWIDRNREKQVFHFKKTKFPVGMLFLLLAFLFSCEEEQDKHAYPIPDWDKLVKGFVQYDEGTIKEEMAKLVIGLEPSKTVNDTYGHEENINTLVDRLNDCPKIRAELLCYSCIKTYPPQSEILVEVDSSGSETTRVLDILTPADSALSFVNIHNHYGETGIKLENVEYLGCFSDNPMGKRKKGTDYTDTVLYNIENDTLKLDVVINYNCCGLLKDSVIKDNEIVNIFLADTCKEYCVCRCMCDFRFEYSFTNFWQKNVHFYIYMKGHEKERYSLWKETKFMDAPD